MVATEHDWVSESWESGDDRWIREKCLTWCGMSWACIRMSRVCDTMQPLCAETSNSWRVASWSFPAHIWMYQPLSGHATRVGCWKCDYFFGPPPCQFAKRLFFVVKIPTGYDQFQTYIGAVPSKYCTVLSMIHRCIMYILMIYIYIHTFTRTIRQT